MTCGIYMIQNTTNGKIYIGQAIDIEKRWKRHVWELDNNKHINKHLQRAWNKDKKENFKFDIICECEENQLNTLEQYYIFELITYDSKAGYNKQYGGNSNKPTDEVRNKISQSTKGKKLSEETKGKISKAHKGKKLSEETKRKISQNNGTKRPEVRKRLQEINKGKIRTEESKKKQSEAQKGRLV